MLDFCEYWKVFELFNQNVCRVMRIAAALMLTCCLHVTAKTVSQTITLSGKNLPFITIISEIRKQCGYEVFYNADLLHNKKPVSVDAHHQLLTEFLDEVFHPQELDYDIQSKTIILKMQVTPSRLRMIASSDLNPSPPFPIRGIIRGQDGRPISGASITIRGSKKGIAADNGGSFVINANVGDILRISSTGFSEVQIRIISDTTAVAVDPNWKSENRIDDLILNGNKNTPPTHPTLSGGIPEGLIIFLSPSNSSLQEVVVNKGYYTERQRYSTGNVSTVTAKDIEKQPVNNPLMALQGRVPGLEITQNNGVPGTAVKVRIRGQNSFNNGNEPLYIIDGVPYTSQLMPGLGSILGAAGNDLQGNPLYGNPLSYINPADIESVDVLKDADATAIYGSRAANGAILITTRKGKSGKMRIELNGYTGWGTVTRTPSLLNLREYLDMRLEALKNDGQTANENDFDLTIWDTTRSTDWRKILIGNNANYTNIQLSLSGGNSAMQYLIGGTYGKESTVFPGNFNDKKVALHFNITSLSADQRFKVALTGNYLNDNNKLLQEDLTRYTNLSPNAPTLLNSDGSLNWALTPSGFATWDNPLTFLMRKYNNRTSNLVANSTLSYQVFKGFETKISLGYTNQQSNEISTFPLSSISPNVTVPKSNASFADNNISSWIVEPQLTYKYEIGKGRLDILAGATFQSNTSNGNVVNASGFSTDALIENRKAAAIVTIISTTNNLYKYNAGFGRLNFNWQDKYLINVTGRRDGSSRFGPQSRFHNFAAVGTGWIFTNENFIKNTLKFLSYGKIRVSYGTTGNDQIGDYRYIDLYYPTNYNYQGQNGLIANNLFNPSLAWEKTTKTELAAELAFFNDRLYLSGSLFKNRSSNQLLGYALPSITGFRTIDANQDALIENRGLEVQVNATVFQKKSFRWTTSFNITSTKNRVIRLGPNYFGDKNIEGHSLSTSYVNHLVGVDPATGQYQFLSKTGDLTFNPDTFYFDKDLNPAFFGGFQNSITYKGFAVDILLQFIKQLSKNYLFGNNPGLFGAGPNQPRTVLDRWQKAGDRKNIQKYNQDGSLIASNEAASGSETSYSDASFIRLKNIAISYNLPAYLLNKISLSSCKFYVQCQNLLTITNLKDIDPETKSIYSLPPLRIITAGIQITF